MGRQTDRTNRAIYSAFSELLNQKKYSRISMQEIADLADVGRSTIYSHFETKEDILTSMCSDIFDNLVTTDHITTNEPDTIVVAFLTHIQENSKVIKGVFLSEGMDVFVDFCRNYFSNILEEHILIGYDEKSNEIPKDSLINYLITTFVETIRWWIKNDMKQSSQEIAGYYLKIISSFLLLIQTRLINTSDNRNK